jgi:hypothetical protein
VAPLTGQVKGGNPYVFVAKLALCCTVVHVLYQRLRTVELSDGTPH